MALIFLAIRAIKKRRNKKNEAAENNEEQLAPIMSDGDQNMLYYSKWQTARIVGVPIWRFWFMEKPRSRLVDCRWMYRQDDIYKWCQTNGVDIDAAADRMAKEKGW